MSTTAAHTSARSSARASAGPIGWFRSAEDWLDQRGRAAWIAAMVLGFIFVWPVGLALLAYMIWGKRMFGKSCRHRGNHGSDRQRAWASEWGRTDRTAWRPSGNATFDAYKADTLRRLEDEQEAFEGFLQRLREAKDKTEFDSFMDDRARRTRAGEGGEADTGATSGTVSGPGAEGDARRGEY